MGNKSGTTARERREMNMLETAGGTQWMNCQCTKNQQTKCKVVDGQVKELGMKPGFKTDVATSHGQATSMYEPALIGGFTYRQ